MIVMRGRGFDGPASSSSRICETLTVAVVFLLVDIVGTGFGADIVPAGIVDSMYLLERDRSLVPGNTTLSCTSIVHSSSSFFAV